LISELNSALDICSIIVSHDVPDTLSISDQVYIISTGKVVGSGSPDELKDSKSEWTHQFIHGDSDGPVPFHYPASPILNDLYGS